MAEADHDAIFLAKINDLIAEIQPGAFVQKAVCIIEVMQPDGDRALWSVTDPGQKCWDTLGLLSWGVQLQQAHTVQNDGFQDDD